MWRRPHLFPAAIRHRRDKIGFETPQARWITNELRPLFTQWAAKPSDRLHEMVDIGALRAIVPQVVDRETHRMDERHLLLMRLYFLDAWLRVYGVQ